MFPSILLLVSVLGGHEAVPQVVLGQKDDHVGYTYTAGLDILVDKDKCRRAGLQVADVANAIEAFLSKHKQFKLSELSHLKLQVDGQSYELQDLATLDVRLVQVPPPKNKD
jgi:hypothetical protein